MRSKEFANDYRYFTEPDLPPLIVAADEIERVRASMPELPSERRARYVRDYGLTPYEVGVITQDRETADYFDQILKQGNFKNVKPVANWVMSEVLRIGTGTVARATSPAEIASLLLMVESSKISLNAAKTAFPVMIDTGQTAAATVESLGLAQVSDEAAIAAACDIVLGAEPDKVAEFRSGRDKLFGFFVGQVMKAMGGKANPRIINEVLRRKLSA
jgi:aspartyl-tRNA(Asn)/glutamyl-tRNA(Gln) amidotransferase subunit B